VGGIGATPPCVVRLVEALKNSWDPKDLVNSRFVFRGGGPYNRKTKKFMGGSTQPSEKGNRGQGLREKENYILIELSSCIVSNKTDRLTQREGGGTELRRVVPEDGPPSPPSRIQGVGKK